jgi:dolichol kinase
MIRGRKVERTEESYFGSESEGEASGVSSVTSMSSEEVEEKGGEDSSRPRPVQSIEGWLVGGVGVYTMWQDERYGTLFMLLVISVMAFGRDIGQLYEVVFPPVIAATVGQDVGANMILAISPLLKMYSGWWVVFGKMVLVANVDGRAVMLDGLYGWIGSILKDVCGESLTGAEYGLFSTLIVNLIVKKGQTVAGEYTRLVVLLPMYSAIASLGYLLKLNELTCILGPHKRPANSDSLKRSYTWKIAATFLGTLLFLTYTHLDVKGTVELVEYAVGLRNHQWILGYWLLFLIIGAPLIMRKSGGWMLDQRRKVWHFCVVLMFLPTGAIDAQFTGLSFGVALTLFFASEIIRACAIPPWGTKLHAALLPYTDRRDLCGPVIVSHIFLLLGIALPIMLVGSPAGILCLGLGDAAASLFGRRYGRHKWPGGSKKTIEGSAAFVLTAMVGLLACKFFGYSDMPSFLRMTLTAAMTALLEATSAMNDNVIVPLFMLVVLHSCISV